jgi:hypothetical protein
MVVSVQALVFCMLERRQCHTSGLRAGAMDHGKSTFQPKPLQPTLKRPSDVRLAGPTLLDLLKLGQSRRDSRGGSYDKNPC